VQFFIGKIQFQKTSPQMVLIQAQAGKKVDKANPQKWRLWWAQRREQIEK
jgi:hypothetical protein